MRCSTLPVVWFAKSMFLVVCMCATAATAASLDFDDAQFASNSGVITHPFFSAAQPGFQLRLVGEGQAQGQVEEFLATGYDTYAGIHTLMWTVTTTFNGVVGSIAHNHFAQDTDGNLWVLAMFIYVNGELVSSITTPQLVLPHDVAQVGLSWFKMPGFEMEVVEVDATVPVNAHGQGPFPGCVVAQAGAEDTLSYYAPQLGQILITFPGGAYRLAAVNHSAPTWTPLPGDSATPTPHHPVDTPTPGQEPVFAGNSHIITHPFSSAYQTGFYSRSRGEGLVEDAILEYQVQGAEVFQGINCLRLDNATWSNFNAFFQILLAQDIEGNVWRVGQRSYQNGELMQTGTEKILVLPHDLARVGLTWQQGEIQELEVIEIDHTLPENQYGLGPFPGCVVVESRIMSSGQVNAWFYYAPGVSSVKMAFSDDRGGYEVDLIDHVSPIWTPQVDTTDPINTPTVTPTVDAVPTFTPISPEPDFPANSGVITHPYLTNYAPGMFSRFEGYGSMVGLWQEYRGIDYVEFQGIHCLKVEHSQLAAGNIHVVDMYFAQDNAGNVWRLGIRNPQTQEFDDPLLLLPANLTLPGLVWGRAPYSIWRVAATNQTLPINDHGMGPFSNVVTLAVSHHSSHDIQSWQHFAPHLGFVWVQLPGSESGLRLSSLTDPDASPTPTPTPGEVVKSPTPGTDDTPPDHLDVFRLSREWGDTANAAQLIDLLEAWETRR